jgi:hypothetical protein
MADRWPMCDARCEDNLADEKAIAPNPSKQILSLFLLTGGKIQYMVNINNYYEYGTKKTKEQAA